MLTACGAPGATGQPARDPVVLPEVRVTKTDPADLEKLFRAATDRLVREEFREAAAELDRIAGVDPAGPWAAPSLFNAGVAHASLGELETAASRFRASFEKDPTGPTSKLALVRLARVSAYLEKWRELEETARALRSRQDLSVLERVEALGALGLALVSQDRVDEAFEVVVEARDTIEDKRLGEAGAPPPELAQVAFALGEIRRKKSETITFVPFPLDFGAKLEARCQGLLDAQNAYTDAMRSLDAHWSAMAGFRVGQLYQRLHRDLMQVGVPEGARTVRQKQLWEGAMRLRYRILLEKGLTMMDATVRLGERTGESSPWITRAREAKKELESTLALEKEALSKMPFSEEEMREALEQLKGKKPAPAAPPPKK